MKIRWSWKFYFFWLLSTRFGNYFGEKNPLGLNYHTSNTFTKQILAKMLIVVVVLLLFPEASETCQMKRFQCNPAG